MSALRHRPRKPRLWRPDGYAVPLPSILATKFEQPTFGANYFTFDIKPSADGGLTNGTTAEVRFKDQPMFQFVATLEKTRERAIYMKRQEAENEEGPREFNVLFRFQSALLEIIMILIRPAAVYTSPTEGSSTSSAGVNTIPGDAPPGYDS